MRERVTVDDFKDKGGKWVQRTWVGKKYTWTVSGVLWNNVKERCTAGGSTQTQEPTYKGAVNLFKGFQEFVEWHRKQVGYGLGYELDADILKNGNKVYSENTCLLIPSALNRFLQSYKGGRGVWPQGMYMHSNANLLVCRIGRYGEIDKSLGCFAIKDVDKAVAAYTEAKNLEGFKWYKRLLTNDFSVDERVIQHMKDWRYVCEWSEERKLKEEHGNSGD